MSATHSLRRRLAAALLRAALLGSLFAAGWGIHRSLPREEAAAPPPARREPARESALRIRLRAPLETRADVSAVRIPVQFYPIDMAAARSEYDSERRPGQRFEEFATRLMAGRQPVTAEIDERGEAVVALAPGRWWVHLTLEGPREVTWRLPVTVTGREKTVELTPANAYLKAKEF
jgi:hypothetical protein